MKKLTYMINPFLKAINFIVPKKRNSLYFEPLENCKKDKYDLINHSGDSLLTFLNYLLQNSTEKDYDVTLVVYDESRVSEYKSYVENYRNYRFRFLYRDLDKKKRTLSYFIKMLFAQFRSRYIFTESLVSNKLYMTKRQNAVCLSYYSSFKDDIGIVKINEAKKEWKLITATSKLDAMMKSVAYHIPVCQFVECGLPRNDYLLKPLSEEVRSSIYKTYGIDEKTDIILYAPTYRDYESDNCQNSRNVLNVDDEERLVEMLRDKNCLVVVKQHSWQNLSVISGWSDRIVSYVDSYDYSFYDLMKMSSLLITDYSSICLDWIFLNKPVIYYLYDIERYMETRGFFYEPYDEYCAGEIVYSDKDIINAIIDNLENDRYKDKRAMVMKMAHRNNDANCCQRIYDYIF